MSEITVEPSLKACSEAWRMHVEGKDNFAIAQELGLGGDEVWRVYRYLNLHIKANINPEAGDGDRQFILMWDRYNKQYEMCGEEIDAIDRDIASCESMRDVTGLRRVKIAAINQMTIITKHLQGLLGLDTINIRLFADIEQNKADAVDYSKLGDDELMTLMGEKLSK